MVFVGGATTGLLITDPAASPVRMTDDVDLIVEVATALEYSLVSQRLSRKGFAPSMDLDCRWTLEALVLDLMPTRSEILGFANRWYPLAVQSAQMAELDGIPFRHISAPAFLATKLTAFEDRGRGDYYGSHDLEDVVRVISGRAEITEEIRQSDPSLKEYLRSRFDVLLGRESFLLALEGHLVLEGPGRARVVEERMRTLIDLS